MLYLMESVYPFPEMLGTEEETRFKFSDSSDELWDSSFKSLLSYMDETCPTLPGNDEFRENGSRIYIDSMGIELATPEVSHPVDQLIYVKAGARLLIESIARKLSVESSESGLERSAIFQRRVVDNKENTWGVHDNLSIWHYDYINQVSTEGTDVAMLWNNYLRTRNFITGAMRVDRVTTFSQKLSVDHIYTTKNYNNSLIYANYLSMGPRLEVRSNDVNLQEWAFLSRVGGAALLLAASQTELLEQLTTSNPYFAKQNRLGWNIMPLDNDLELNPSGSLHNAIDFQYYTVRTILDQLEDHIGQPIPTFYRQTGEAILQFCEDVEAVIAGKRDLATLVGRADWAGKLMVIREHMQRQPAGRYLGDAKSKLLDLWYDQITISAQPDGNEPRINYGYGYKQADASSSRSYDDAVEAALTNPPNNTRATKRVDICKTLGDFASNCSWDSVSYRRNGSLEKIYF